MVNSEHHASEQIRYAENVENRFPQEIMFDRDDNGLADAPNPITEVIEKGIKGLDAGSREWDVVTVLPKLKELISHKDIDRNTRETSLLELIKKYEVNRTGNHQDDSEAQSLIRELWEDYHFMSYRQSLSQINDTHSPSFEFSQGAGLVMLQKGEFLLENSDPDDLEKRLPSWDMIIPAEFRNAESVHDREYALSFMTSAVTRFLSSHLINRDELPAVLILQDVPEKLIEKFQDNQILSQKVRPYVDKKNNPDKVAVVFDLSAPGLDFVANDVFENNTTIKVITAMNKTLLDNWKLLKTSN